MSMELIFTKLILTLIPDASEKEENAKKSLERAKEAVALDVKDGSSWSM